MAESSDHPCRGLVLPSAIFGPRSDEIRHPNPKLESSSTSLDFDCQLSTPFGYKHTFNCFSYTNESLSGSFTPPSVYQVGSGAAMSYFGQAPASLTSPVQIPAVRNTGATGQGLAESSYTPPPYFGAPTITRGAPSRPAAAPASPPPTDVAALQSMLNSLQAELKATNSVNTHLAATVARLQAEQAPPAPTTTTDSTPTPTPTTSTTPTPSATPNATNTTNTELTTHAPIPCSHPDHPRTIASGRGAGSPELFQQIIKTNWHGRLGRTHMAEVDNLPASALAELDCLLRRKLHAVFPRNGGYAAPDADTIFSSLAALGLRLEDRGAYADLPVVHDNTLHGDATTRRGKNFATHYYAHGKYVEYWQGFVLETMVELARYRGLFDDEGFLKVV